MVAASEGLRRIIARKEDGAQLWFEEALQLWFEEALQLRWDAYGGGGAGNSEAWRRFLGEGGGIRKFSFWRERRSGRARQIVLDA